MEDPKVFDSQLKVQKIYEIIYPYGKFEGDYSHACIAIRRELKQLCKDRRKDLLIVINRALELPVNPNDSIQTLCDNIINNIINKCLSIPSASVNVMLNLKQGIVPKSIEKKDIKTRGDSRSSITANDVILVTHEMQSFLHNAGLGLSDPENLQSTPLSQILLVGYNGITTRNMLTKLLKIYKILSMGDLRFIIKFFDKNNLPTIYGEYIVDYIIKDNIIKQENLSQSEKDRLRDPMIVNRLNQEFDLVSKILSYYIEKDNF